MNQASILIAMNSQQSAMKLRELLVNNQFHVIDICLSGSVTLRKVRIAKPDILIVNYDLRDTTGYEISQIVIKENLSSVILLTNSMQKDYVDSQKDFQDIICINKPFNPVLLFHTIEIALKNGRRIRKLEKEVMDLKLDLETRKRVEHAKRILMKNMGLSEAEAYRNIQKRSMDSGVPMKGIAEMIIKNN